MKNTEILKRLGTYGVGIPAAAALFGVAGHAVLPTAIAAAAGTAGVVAAACATGAAVMMIPYFTFYHAVNNICPETNHPFLNPLLMTVIKIGMLCDIATVGASVFGLSAQALTLSLLVGGFIVIPAAIVAVAAIIALTKAKIADDAVFEVYSDDEPPALAV